MKTLDTADHLLNYNESDAGVHNHEVVGTESGPLIADPFSNNKKSMNLVLVSAMLLVWIIFMLALTYYSKCKYHSHAPLMSTVMPCKRKKRNSKDSDKGQRFNYSSCESAHSSSEEIFQQNGYDSS